MSGAHIAAHVAAQKRKREHEEEERMTNYAPQDLEQGWEFKIVRSVTSEFKKTETFRRLLEEEALSGWELLEKLDDGRVRFKRPTSARKRDAMLPRGVDPYRTQHGISEAALAVRIVAVVLIGMTLLISIAMMIESGTLF